MRRLVFVFAALLTATAVRAHAQPPGVLAGTVHTSEGTPVPNLVLVVHGPDAARTVVTGPEGRYRLAGLTPGERLQLTKRIQDASRILGQFHDANLEAFSKSPAVWMPVAQLP